MAEMMTTDVRAIMDRTPFDASAVADLREVLNRDPSRYRTLREAVANIREREKKDDEAGDPSPAGRRRGLLGRYASGLEHLKKAGEVGMAFFFQGLAYENLQKYDEAAKAFAARGQARLRRQEFRAAPRGGPPPHRARGGSQEDPRRPAAKLSRLIGRVPLPAGGHPRRRRRAVPGRGRVREGPQPRQGPQRGPVRAGLHQRSLRQRRHGRRPLQAVHRASPRAAGRLDQPGRPLRGRDAVPRGRAVLSPGPGPRAEPSPRPAVRQGLPGEQGDVLRRGSREGLHGPQAAPRDPRDRLRALGPEPELPAEDEYPHAGRPDPDHRGRAPGQQELRRDVALRDQGDDDTPRACAWAWPWRASDAERPPTIIASSRPRKFPPRCRRS